MALKLRTFKVRVYVVPSILETTLTGAGPHWEEREVDGYSLTDAKRRAGIQ